jgi:hypothetical protein
VLLAPLAPEGVLGPAARFGDARYSDVDPVVASANGPPLGRVGEVPRTRTTTSCLRDFDPDSGQLGQEIDVSADGVADDVHPALAVAPSGDLWLAWDRVEMARRGSSLPAFLRPPQVPERIDVTVRCACVRGGQVLLRSRRRRASPTASVAARARACRPAAGCRRSGSTRPAARGSPTATLTGRRADGASASRSSSSTSTRAAGRAERARGERRDRRGAGARRAAAASRSRAWRDDRADLRHARAAIRPTRCSRRSPSTASSARAGTGSRRVALARATAAGAAALAAARRARAGAHAGPLPSAADRSTTRSSRARSTSGDAPRRERRPRRPLVRLLGRPPPPLVDLAQQGGMEPTPSDRWVTGRDVHLCDFMALTDHTGEIDPVTLVASSDKL